MEDISGKKFGYLTAIERSGTYVSTQGKRQAIWECNCDCGNVIFLRRCKIVTGHTKSCGCHQQDGLKNIDYGRTHGLSKHRIHAVWCNLKQRCKNKNHIKYKDYGGRGISLCDRWHNFEHFISDMGMPPSEKHSIDRIDVNGNYEPGNCRWATAKEQANNKRCHSLPRSEKFS